MTQENLAGRAGVTASYVGHIERGGRMAALETVVTLARILDLSLDEALLPDRWLQTSADREKALALLEMAMEMGREGSKERR